MKRHEAKILSYSFDEKVKAEVCYIKLPLRKYFDFVLTEGGIEIQRRFLGARLYQRLIADIIQGAVIPPIATIGNNVTLAKDRKILVLEERSSLAILDGLQRTHCLKIVENILRKGEKSKYLEAISKNIPDFNIESAKFKDVNNFLDNYEILIEVWLNMDLKKTLYKMIVLNTGQRKMSLEHQLDILSLELRKILEKIRIKTYTEKELKEGIIQKRIESEGGIKLHVVTEGIVSYLKASPTKNKQDAVMFLFERLDSFEDALSAELIGDIHFVFQKLHPKFKYSDSSDEEKYVLSTYDPVLISLMAAIGKARKVMKHREKELEQRLEDLATEKIRWDIFFEYYKRL